MAQNPDEIRQALDQYLSADFRGRIRAKGIARGMVWRNGVVPEGSPQFAESLSADLLDLGYIVLTLALELRDANRELYAQASRFETKDAFVFAAEAIESAVRRGDSSDGDQGRHLVIGATAFHLAGFAARSYSMLPPVVLENNLSSNERALALLLRRDLVAMRGLVVNWFERVDHADDAISQRLANPSDDFGPDDAVLLALNSTYFRALGLADTALLTGNRLRMEDATTTLTNLIAAAGNLGNVPIWWVATLTRHLLVDLWDQSLHTCIPLEGGPSSNWTKLRRDFIDQLCAREPPHIDLWPSQMEAARRAIDPTDDLIIALPTSAGKTRIAELCILRALADDKRVVYVTPLRALSAQVERVLARTFVPMGATVTSLYGAVGASSDDDRTLASASIVVATPEKLDFALRQAPEVISDVGLIVLDEGHMIGLGSREIRYEVLIQRLLRRSDAHSRRIVCLSAMFNPEDEYFKDFGAWLRSDAHGDAIHVPWHPTRRRLAQLDWFANSGTARLAFIEGEESFVPRFIEREDKKGKRQKPFPKDDKEFCLAAANAFARDGHAVLIYSPQRSQIDPLVRAFEQGRRQGYLLDIKSPAPSELSTALAVGREWLGCDHVAVKALENGVGTHHGALPRPFQSAVEELLARKRLPVVVASPTLAQGLDPSCSVLVFRSLTRFNAEAKGHTPISPAEFANVVGRAGRAYVDLDGIVVLPSFDSAQRKRRHPQFKDLIEKSRSQRLISGLAHLVAELAERVAKRLGLDVNKLFEHAANSLEVWSDKRLQDADEDDDEEEESDARSVEEYIADLDVAILSLVEPIDAPIEQLAVALDDILKDSLWKRTLSHMPPEYLKAERDVIVSRAQWLWTKTSVEQRRACFSAGLGARAGTFVFDQLDYLIAVLAGFQTSIANHDVAAVADFAVKLAEAVTVDSFFAVRKPPSDWREVLSKWVTGVAFAEILEGLGTREEQKVQAFVQDGVVFRLVWAAEAVRVQAVSTGHSRAGELGDGPMLVLTHGVPSIAAALLCQAGYASRTGAVWLTTKLKAGYAASDTMREWIMENDSALQDPDFWAHADHRLLWERVLVSDADEYPCEWRRETREHAVRWRKRPDTGSFVRLVTRNAKGAVVCTASLEPIGEVDLDFDSRGVVLEGVVLPSGRLQITHYGPWYRFEQIS